MTTPLVVFGAGGHGRELLDVVAMLPEFELLGIIDDAGDSSGHLARRGIPVIGGRDLLAELDAEVALGLGDSARRREIDGLLQEYGRRSPTLLHPTAVLGSDLRIGAGFVAAAGAQVTTNVTIGRHVHLNIGATVSHDCVLEDYVTLSPGCHVSGNVHLGAGVTLGVGAVVRPGVTVGDGTFVGAGAVVVGDLPPAVTAVGVPARVHRI